MPDPEVVSKVAKQRMSGNTVEVDGKSIPIRRTRSPRLKNLGLGVSIRPSNRALKSQACGVIGPDRPSGSPVQRRGDKQACCSGG